MNSRIRTAREKRRAAVLHERFLWVRDQWANGRGNLVKLFRAIRPEIRRRQIPFSEETFYRIFQEWRKNPIPETLMRRWHSAGKKIPAEAIASVELAALRNECTVQAAARNKASFSLTTLWRRSRNRVRLRELAALSRKRSRILRSLQDERGLA